LDANTFWQNRNYRMNFYAVKALQARAFLYRGNKTEAYAAATYIIQKADEMFKWATSAQPNRLFSSEVIFGLESRELYDHYNRVFVFTARDQELLAPTPERLAAVMESNTFTTDLRNTAFWFQSTYKSFKTFCKFADNTSTVPSEINNLMPMLRKTEMYYIAAECAPDMETAVGYLNTVRIKRQVPALPIPFNGVLNGITSSGVVGEIAKEYLKDLYGEGQMFFYYKRTNTKFIPNGSSIASQLPPPPGGTTGNSNWVYLDKAKYVFPIPTNELGYR